MARKIHLSLRISRELQREIKRLSAEQGISQAQVIAQALAEYRKEKPADLQLHMQLLEGQDRIIAELQEIRKSPMLQLGIVQQQRPAAPQPAIIGPAKTKRKGLRRLLFWKK